MISVAELNEEETVKTRTSDFVMSVVYDGRYVEEIADDPAAVAQRLGLALDDGIQSELEGRSNEDIVADACRDIRERIARAQMAELTEMTDTFRPPQIDFFISSTIVGLAIVTYVVVDVATGVGKGDEIAVTDNSPDADSKI